MEVTLTYYGKLVELIGKTSEEINIDNSTVNELLLWLENEYPAIAQLSIQIAQDHTIGKLDDNITAKQIDVFPPFSGG